MEVWLDTINASVIKDAVSKINVTGVTTNPSILSGAKTAIDAVIHQLLEIQPGKVAVQITALDQNLMLQQARRLAKISQRIIIKVPVTQEGLAVIKQLKMENIATMATAIFNKTQVYLSILSGAEYAAPYLDRIEQKLGNSLLMLKDSLQLISNSQSSLKIIGAAISSTEQFLDCAAFGAQAITIPEKIYHDLLAENPFTTKSLEQFQTDWKAQKLTQDSLLFCE